MIFSASINLLFSGYTEPLISTPVKDVASENELASPDGDNALMENEVASPDGDDALMENELASLDRDDALMENEVASPDEMTH